MMKKLYPLKFEPVLKTAVWGGDNLVKKYGRCVPSAEDGNPLIDVSRVAESWDLSAMDGMLSVITNGFLAENDLPDILETYMGDLVGDEVFEKYNLLFPLLVKTLDVKGRLSVQVHPDDEAALERYDSLGKTELWYVQEASENARVYLGFNQDTDASTFYEACKNGTVLGMLNEFHPRKGDIFFIRAGSVHTAIGEMVISEIQESSDLTFRLYDWGREFNPATARPMQLEEALDLINFNILDEADCHFLCPSGSSKVFQCEHFAIEHLAVGGECILDVEEYGSFVILICTEGSVNIEDSGSSEAGCSLIRSEIVMIPASLDEVVLKGEGSLLLVYVSDFEETDSYLEK